MRAPSPRAWWASGPDTRSAGAGEAVVVAAAVLVLFGLLLGLGLEQVGLARDLGRGVPVRLPVHLLGAAEEFLRLGLRLAPDAHGAILSQVIGLPAVSLAAMLPGLSAFVALVGFRGPVRSSLVPRCDAPGPVSLLRTGAGRRRRRRV